MNPKCGHICVTDEQYLPCLSRLCQANTNDVAASKPGMPQQRARHHFQNSAQARRFSYLLLRKGYFVGRLGCFHHPDTHNKAARLYKVYKGFCKSMELAAPLSG